MYLEEWNKIAEEVNFNLDIDLVRTLDEIPVKSRVLDFGCGYGRVGKLLHDSGYRNIIGVDSSIKMIERGEREFPELSFQVNSGRTLSFPDNSFDAVIVCAVFTCITSQKTRLSQINELYRVLKPGGVLHMVEFCSEPSREFIASIGVPMLHSRPAELRELVSMLDIINEETATTKTMGGNAASSYSVFATKSLNKALQRTSR
jgi:ubiquinone/menaquinone biosynthesis C-methylase UbiE